MKVSTLLYLVPVVCCLSLTACHKPEEHEQEEHHKIVATSPKVEDITVTQQYVCQIRSRRHISVKALQDGYLEAIPIREGQPVKEGDVMFRVVPTLYKARMDAEMAKARVAQIKFEQTKKLAESNTARDAAVSQTEVALQQAELDEANAKAKLAAAEVDFTVVKAPFDGIVDRLQAQQGSLVKKEDVLTTLSDNSVVWVYFNVPECRYFEYKTREGTNKDTSRLELVDSRIELVLADGTTFPQTAGNTVTVPADFNNETGNIPFRADFPNPDALLRHGQTGNVLIRRKLHHAVVIPQRATFELLEKRYVFVVDKGNVVRQREIVVQHEMDDIYVIKSGVTDKDKIVLEGVRQIRDGETLKDVETVSAEHALAHQKHPAE